MADPAWGSTSSLSDEETARALCAFQHTEPLPTQRRWPLHLPPPAPLHQRRSANREMPQLRPATGRSAFGGPTRSATYHMVPMTVRRNEAASVLVDMHAPSTASDDWQRQQQRNIQEQIEQQQRELQAQTQRQQQRDVHVQLQQLQAQMQAPRQVERQQQPRYASGASGFEEMRWSNDGQAASVARPSCHDGGHGRGQDFVGQREQQSGHFYDGRLGRSQQLPARPTTTPTSTPLFMQDYWGSSQVSRSSSEGMFAPQQVPQPAQSHLQARHPELVSVSALHQWGRHEPMSFTGALTDRRTLAFQRQTRPQQPQPYHPTETTERSRQEAVQNATRFHPDEIFLNGIMKHFPTGVGASAGVPATSAGVSFGSNAGHAATRNITSMFNPSADRARFQTRTEMQIQRQLDAHSKPPVPPTGTAVVPGISLASESARLLTMRDLLNGDDGSSKADSSRIRFRGSKQQRAPPKRKTPRKKTPAKRQRTPQQQHERRFQPPPANRLAGGIQPRQGVSPVLIGASGLVAKPSTPMYRAFMESRAARALEQTVDHANTRPTWVTPLLELQQPTPVTQSATNRRNGQAVDFITQGPNPAKRKKFAAPQGPSSTHQSSHQPAARTRMSPTDEAKPETVLDKGAPDCLQPNASESCQWTGEAHTIVNGQVQVGGDFDYPMDGVFGLLQRQQSAPILAVPEKLVSSLRLVENGETGASSKKRHRAKLPAACSQLSTLASGPPQKSPCAQSSNGEFPTVSGPTAARAVTSSSMVQIPAVSRPPRVENRTVVIFCKRDFMRYQAAKIWRKYQEQLKKHEEWREVRVAGKRTRYLNSRYDNELQKTCRRTYTRSGKPRRKTSQDIRSHKASIPTAGSAPVDSTVSSSTSVENGGDERISTTRELGQTAEGESAGSGISSNVGGAHSISAKSGIADNDNPMRVQDASEAQRKYPSTIEDETRSAGASNVSNNPSNGAMGDCTNAQVQQGLDSTVSNGNLGTASTDIALECDAVADTSSSGNVEVANATAEVTPPTPDAVTENTDPSVANVSCTGSAKANNAAPASDNSPTAADEPPKGGIVPSIAESFSNCTIEVTSSELDINVGSVVANAEVAIDSVAVADAPSNGAIEASGLAPDGTLGSAVAKAASVVAVVTNTTSDVNMGTDAKAGEDTGDHLGNDDGHPCGEPSSQSSIEAVLFTLEQSTIVAEGKHSCTDSGAREDAPPDQPGCPGLRGTIGDAAASVEMKQPCPDPATHGDSDPDKPSDGVKRNTGAGTESSLSDIKPSTEEALASTTIKTNGADSIEAKPLCTDSATLHDVHRDKPAYIDPVTNSNGNAAV